MGIATAAVPRTAEKVVRHVRFSPAPAKIERCPTACSSCSLRTACLPGVLHLQFVGARNVLGSMRGLRRRRDIMKRAGAQFESLYAVRSGFFKSYVLAEDGREQVTGFQMAGDIVGLESIEADAHGTTVEALDDSIVCVIPFAALERTAGRLPGLQRQLFRMLSREIARDQSMMMLLGTMHAEGRVAAFLLNLSQRFHQRGYADAEFNLRMTREEIGSYLGLKLETVSRVFSRLQQSRLIDVQNRHVRIRDVTGLKSMLVRAGAR